MRDLLRRRGFEPTIRGAPFGIAFVAGGYVGDRPLSLSWWLVALAAAIGTTMLERAIKDWLPEKPADCVAGSAAAQDAR